MTPIGDVQADFDAQDDAGRIKSPEAALAMCARQVARHGCKGRVIRITEEEIKS